MTTLTPTHCSLGFGPSPLEKRSGPCKICYSEISIDEASITHAEDPCHTVFHFECLSTWLPYAAHVPVTSDLDVTGPSCPNCRKSLGECDLSEMKTDADLEEETRSVLPRYAYPIESLEELRMLVGNEEFDRFPMHGRRFVRPVSFDEVRVEQPRVPLQSTQDLHTASRVFVQEQSNAVPTNVSLDIEELLATNDTQSNAIPEIGPLPADAVQNHLQENHRFHGVTRYEAYHFDVPGFSNTCFYLPIYPVVQPLSSLTELRELIHSRRVFHDPEHVGRWLRNPILRSPREMIDGLTAQQNTAGLILVESLQNLLWDARSEIDLVDLEGWALWLPSDIEQHDVVYAVPRILVKGAEEGEIRSGFLLRDLTIDTGDFWAPFQPRTSEEHEEILSSFGGSQQHVWRHGEIEVMLYDKAFEREMLTLPGGGVVKTEDAQLPKTRQRELDLLMERYTIEGLRQL